MEASEARGTTRATCPHRTTHHAPRRDGFIENSETKPPPRPWEKELKELRLRNQNKLSFEQYTNMYSL